MSNKKNELQNLRSQTMVELQKILKEVNEKIILGKSQQKDKNIHLLKNLRQTRSRILTVFYEKQIQGKAN